MPSRGRAAAGRRDRSARSQADDPGEILVRGANLFSGYWPDGDGGAGRGGWFATGDVGFLDDDGDLFLVDRLKELVIVSGFNVYPSEIEEVVAEVDGVARGARSSAYPTTQTGEAVVAYVVPGTGRTQRHEELADRVRAHCETRLARFKVPGRIEVVDDLPAPATGKVAKGRLRATLRPRARWACSERAPACVLYTRPGCHLCDDARAVVEAVCAELGESLRRGRHQRPTPSSMQQFGEEIPVTFVDGEQHDFWRVDPERLRAALPADFASTPQTGVPLRGSFSGYGCRNVLPGGPDQDRRVRPRQGSKKNPPPNGSVYSSSGSPLRRSWIAEEGLERLLVAHERQTLGRRMPAASNPWA